MAELNHVTRIPNKSLLATLDVKSLNASIPNNEGIEAVTEAYDKQPSKIISTTTKKKKPFLGLILSLNNFLFNCFYSIYKLVDVRWA